MGRKRQPIRLSEIKKLGIIGEFKKFALRGNVIDLAVGVIIGGAFQKIVTSVVGDLAMPLISAITGKVDYNDMFLILKLPENPPAPIDVSAVKTLKAAQDLGITTLNYGAFITTVIDFFIMALVIFLMVKMINRLTEVNKKAEEKPKPTEKECPFCLSDIPVKAMRCKYCTSPQPEDEDADGEQSEDKGEATE